MIPSAPLATALEQRARAWLAGEARALAARVRQHVPFTRRGIAVAPGALRVGPLLAIDRALGQQARAVLRELDAFVDALARQSPAPASAQRSLTVLRMRAAALATNVDVFADVLVQRAEPALGLELAGLDVLADAALVLPPTMPRPSILCYLDRGQGASIRRARTRLPGGGMNPVAIVRVPVERMTGVGVGTSVCHEVGHQAAALLDLVPAVREPLLRHRGVAARQYARWISEIVADLWALMRMGPAATAGLIGVLGLPRAFMLRASPGDPHPPPWLRVPLSCAFGEALWPDPIWARLRGLWLALHPAPAPGTAAADALDLVLAGMPTLVELVLQTRVPRLRARLGHALPDPRCRPGAMAQQLAHGGLAAIETTDPTHALALVGAARLSGLLEPGQEPGLVRDLLTHWALQRELQPS
ncbi:MAG: hypothetical protein K1X88_29810 [Nannocystaceae bacterium]|nr:hypothetical protein [Nannocystaceae bacterium]